MGTLVRCTSWINHYDETVIMRFIRFHYHPISFHFLFLDRNLVISDHFRFCRVVLIHLWTARWKSDGNAGNRRSRLMSPSDWNRLGINWFAKWIQLSRKNKLLMRNFAGGSTIADSVNLHLGRNGFIACRVQFVFTVFQTFQCLSFFCCFCFDSRCEAEVRDFWVLLNALLNDGWHFPKRKKLFK